MKLAEQCNDFVERLLDACHSTEEVNAMLNGYEVVKNDESKEPKKLRLLLLSVSFLFLSTDCLTFHSVLKFSDFTMSYSCYEIPTGLENFDRIF